MYTVGLVRSMNYEYALSMQEIRCNTHTCIACKHVWSASRQRMQYLHCAITSNQSFDMFMVNTIKGMVTNSKPTHVQGRGYFWSPVWQVPLPLSCPVARSVSPSPVLHALDDAPADWWIGEEWRERGRELTPASSPWLQY